MGMFFYLPTHRIELVKRMPICAFPTAWNTAPQEKEDPVQHIFQKIFKNSLLKAIA